MTDSPPATLDAFLDAVQGQDGETARALLGRSPGLADASAHAAAALGRADDLRRMLASDPATVRARAGSQPAEPLLYACYSPFHGDNAATDDGLRECVRILLAAGADPNTKDARHGVPVLFAVTGMREIIPIATMLLDAGASPTDGESVFHAAEKHHVAALELLLSRGADLDHVGDWGNTALWFLMRWWDLGAHETVRAGVEWLLRHGARPDVRSAAEQETALHVAARRGQPVAVIEALLRHGASVDAERGDGRTAWQLAMRGGYDEIGLLLERAGARPRALTAADRLLAACARGDEAEARRLATPALVQSLGTEELRLLPDGAGAGRLDRVRAFVAAGFPVDTVDHMGATALHHAAIEGRTAIVRFLLGEGASREIRDNDHHATALQWAEFGARHVQARGADYPGTISALQ